MIIVGIDVGMKGGIGIINNDNIDVIDMPIKDQFIDIIKLKSLLTNFNDTDRYFGVEKQIAMPRQNCISTFKLGEQVGILKSILCFDKVFWIPPREWQGYFNIYGKGDNTKKESILLAKKMYPNLVFETARGRILDGRSDAVLLTTYIKDKLDILKLNMVYSN